MKKWEQKNIFNKFKFAEENITFVFFLWHQEMHEITQ